MRTAFGACGLLFLAACAPQNPVVTIRQGPDGTMLAKVSGDQVADCTVIDVDADGVPDGQVYGYDHDADLYPVEPGSSADIYADGSYICVVSGGAPMGYVLVTADDQVGTDCNDSSASINPAATETCDSVDNDCDGTVDESGGTATWYADTDSDGFGGATTSTACTMPAGYVEVGGDCNDSDATVNPDAAEVCDGVDQDCNGLADDGLTFSTRYLDVDGDSYGDPTTGYPYCDTPVGAVADGTDCDDTNSSIHPGATDIPSNGVDEDCSGADAPGDVDGDGYIDVLYGGTDCDDANAAVNPGAVEISVNGVDDNCDGAANATDVVEVCATPASDLISYTWILWVRDRTLDANGTATATWGAGGYLATGPGTLCGDLTVTDGHVVAFNGPFDVDGDGVMCSGDVDGDGLVDWCDDSVWGFMLSDTNIATVTANGYPVTVVNTSWGTGSDGLWTVDLL